MSPPGRGRRARYGKLRFPDFPRSLAATHARPAKPELARPLAISSLPLAPPADNEPPPARSCPLVASHPVRLSGKASVSGTRLLEPPLISSGRAGLTTRGLKGLRVREKCFGKFPAANKAFAPRAGGKKAGSSAEHEGRQVRPKPHRRPRRLHHKPRPHHRPSHRHVKPVPHRHF